jgi:hypothetical protein
MSERIERPTEQPRWQRARIVVAKADCEEAWREFVGAEFWVSTGAPNGGGPAIDCLTGKLGSMSMGGTYASNIIQGGVSCKVAAEFAELLGEFADEVEIVELESLRATAGCSAHAGAQE